MSVEAITWALKERVGRSSTKCVLIVLANCATPEESICWPSAEYLADATCQDRKTVIENLRRLRELGYLEDTGERRGRTGQVHVYRLKRPESGTVPKTEAKGADFAAEQSRISLPSVPKSGHGNDKETTAETTEKRPRRSAQSAVVEVAVALLVEAGFDELTARDFLAHKRARKAPLTERAWRDHLRECSSAGWSPMAAAEKVMARNWSGFEAKYVQGQAQASRPRTSRHSGFDGLDYGKGVGDDGSLN